MIMEPKTRRLLRRAVAAIQRWPSSLDMQDWITHSVRKGRRPEPYCGTTACLAGHVALAAGWKPSEATARMENKKWGQIDWAEDVATRLLGLESHLATRLFYLYMWPDEYRDAYDSRCSNRARARVVAQRVEHFIKTGY